MNLKENRQMHRETGVDPEHQATSESVALNFKEFKQSPFYTYGQSRYIYRNKNHEWGYGQLCMFDLCGMNTSSGHTIHSEIKQLPPGGQAVIVNHLSSSLSLGSRSKGFIPRDFRELINNQWLEASSNIKHLNIQDNIIRSVLIIQDPGTYIDPHDHSGTLQAVTFVYSYTQDELSAGKNNIKFYLSDDRVKEVTYPDHDKFYFSFNGDIKHDSTSTKWRFYWIFDLNIKYDIPRQISIRPEKNDWIFLETLSFGT
jgi:hypothetical protein